MAQLFSTPGRRNRESGDGRICSVFWRHLRRPVCFRTVRLLDAKRRSRLLSRCPSVTSIMCLASESIAVFATRRWEKSAFAGMPSTETCMTCHSQVWKDAPVLEPVRASLRSGAPLRWARVFQTPDYVYFNHSIHVNKGIGCASCHAGIDQMPITAQSRPLYMRWCLDCHRQPEKQLRPTNEVFNFAYRPPASQAQLGKSLAQQQHVHTDGLTDCYTCHR